MNKPVNPIPTISGFWNRSSPRTKGAIAEGAVGGLYGALDPGYKRDGTRKSRLSSAAFWGGIGAGIGAVTGWNSETWGEWLA